MRISNLKQHFYQNLSALYSESELNHLFSVFCEKILNINRIQLFQNNEFSLSELQFQEFSQIINDLKTGKPYQQILGETDFYHLKFLVDDNVLIPRPETEELLELAIQKLSVLKGVDAEINILDIGTGSGIIPIVLKKNFPKAKISAIDLSEKAIEIAVKNANLNEVNIDFQVTDYLNTNLEKVYDVIISNPPYIGLNEENEIADSVKEFEPKIALFSPTSNPLIFYEKIAKDCTNFLAKDGWVFLEINQKLGVETRDLFVGVLSEVNLIQDLSGNDRFIMGRK